MSRTNNRQGPLVGVNTFEPVSSNTALTDTVGFLPFGGTGVTAQSGAGNRWIAYNGTTPLLVRTADKVFTLTVQQKFGNAGLNAAGGSAVLNTRRIVRLACVPGAGNVTIAVTTGTEFAVPAHAAAASAIVFGLPNTSGLIVATFTFAAAQAGNVMIYDDGYQQFECVGTSA